MLEEREGCEEAAVRRMSVGRKSATSASGGSESEESESSSMRAWLDIVEKVYRRRCEGWIFWGGRSIQRYLIGRSGSKR